MVRIGGVFRRGPRFGMSTAWSLKPSAPIPEQGGFRPPPTLDEDPLLPCGGARSPQCGQFRVPDGFGVGVGILPMTNLSIAVDYLRVRYSQMTDNLGETVRENSRVETGDSNQIHVGLEYGYLGWQNPILLRAGAWYDSDHKFQVPAGQPTEDQLLREATVFRPGSNEFHYSFGAGVIIQEWILLDAAMDISELVTTATASLTIRFGS